MADPTDIPPESAPPHPEMYLVCRYCGSDVTHQDDGYYFLCPVHGEIPPADVGKVAAQQHEANDTRA